MYDAALAESGDDKLSAALGRNVLGGAEEMQAAAGQLAAYVRAADRALAAQAGQAIARGDVSFPVPEEIAA